MTDSPDGYYLAAYCIDAVSYERAQVEWIIVFKSITGDWCDRDGHRILPFHIEPITIPTPPIPEGWIEYLHTEADKAAVEAYHETKVDLIQALGIKPKTPAKIERRF